MSLREDILANPACADALAARDCEELARIMSAGRTRMVVVPIADVQAELQSTGAWWAIKAAAADPAHPAVNAATAVLDVAEARYLNLDTSLPIVEQMLSGLVASGIIPQAQMDKIIAMASTPDPMTAQDVAEAMFNPDGSLI